MDEKIANNVRLGKMTKFQTFCLNYFESQGQVEKMEDLLDEIEVIIAPHLLLIIHDPLSN